MADCCDVLIVGSGPAGLAAAIALCLRGVDVLVADAFEPPVDKACGEGLMPDALRELAALGVALETSPSAAFRGIRFIDHRGEKTTQASAEFGEGYGIGIRRHLLHMRMFERAEEIGVRFRWKTHVSLCGQVHLNGQRCAFRYLIGADGQTSQVRRYAALDRGRAVSRRFGFRRHFRIAPWSQFVEVHWCAMGQVYVTPVSEEEVCVAAVTSDPRIRLNSMVDTVPRLREILRDAAPVDKERGAITTTRRLHSVTSGRIALIGDASGSVDAVTGEGMASAFRQSALLADAIEQQNLDLYAQSHQGTLSRAQFMARVLLFLDEHPFVGRRAISMLDAIPGLFSGLLQLHTHDMRKFHGAGSPCGIPLQPLASKNG